MQIVNFFLSRPSVYTLPGTWEKQPLIKHGNYAGLPPEGQIIVQHNFMKLKMMPNHIR